MKLLSGFALLSCLFFQTVHGADADFKTSQARIADAIEKIPASKVKLFLYSLAPNDARRFDGKLPENSDVSFHRIPIIGSVEIIPLQEKTNLLGALAKGVRENDGMIANCFDPRHGIRIVTDTTTNDLVICFECLQVETYGFNSSQWFWTSSSPSATFNGLLDKYHIKKAE